MIGLNRNGIKKTFKKFKKFNKTLYKFNKIWYINSILKRGDGGTGRHVRLRGVWLTPCGFKSRSPHLIKLL